MSLRVLYQRPLRLSILFLFFLGITIQLPAQLVLTNLAPSATVDFSNSMQTTVGSNPSTAFAGAGFDANTAVAGRLNSNAWAFSGWNDGALNYGGTRITAGTDYTRGALAGPGGTGTGGIFAYTGAPGSVANPTMMFQPGGSDFDPGSVTLRVLNNGTTAITQIALSYNLFYRNDQARSDSLNFSWSTDNITYTNVTALDFGTPLVVDALGWQQVGSSPSRSTTISGITVAPTGYLYLRWSHVSAGSSSRDEIGLDDISVTATYSAPCSQPTIQAAINSFSAVGPYQMNVNFTRGNGTGGVLIVASTSSTLSAGPFSWINYAANSNFGNGDAVGGGFVVYSGTANGTGNAASTTVTGLSPNTTYYFFIFEYNVTVPCLMTPGNTGNQLTAAGSATAPTDYFRSIASGNWNNTLTWQSSPDNATWIPASAKPTSSSSGITIRTGHTVTISAPETAKLLTIQTGATLTYANQAAGGYDLDIADGAGDDLQISGTLELYGNAPNFPVATSTFRVFNGGLVRVNFNITPGTGDDFAASTKGFWNTGAIFDWNTNSYTFSNSGITYFPNAAATDIAIFRITQSPNFNIGGSSPTTFLGRFEANAAINFQNSGIKIFRNGIIGTGNVTQLSGCGQFQITGTSAQLGGTGSLNLDANGLLNVSSAVNTLLISNKTVNASASGTFALETSSLFNAQTFVVSGSCNFLVNSGSNLVMGSVDGITTGAAGNIQVSGTRTFSTSGVYIYNAAANQTTGNALPSSIVSPGEIRINNTGAAGNNTTTLTTNNTTTIILRLQQGLFAAGTGQQINIATGGSVSFLAPGGNQSQAASAGYINFVAAGTVSPGTGMQLHNVRLNNSSPTGVNMGGGNTSITGTLDIASGGYVTSGTAPTYTSTPASTLRYSCNCNYGAGEEWYQNTYGTSAGVPHHVTLASGTSLNFNANNYPREMRGDLTINSSSTFALSTASGGDLYIKGNWNNAGGFTNNNRLVKFNGTGGTQVITVTGGGTETFAYLAIEKSAGQSLQLAAAPNATNVTVNGATGGNSFQMISGDLDLNQRTFTFTSHFNGFQNNLGIDGSVGNLVRTINSTGGQGTFNIINTNAGNNVVTVTRMSANASTLIVGANAIMAISSSSGPSGINLGSGLSTINGTLQFNNFGYAVGNSPNYGTGSFLVYNVNGNFDRNVEWCCTSGTGYPYHVIVQGTSFLRLNFPSPNGNADRALAGDLWIKSGATLQMSSTVNNKLTVGRDFTLDGTFLMPPAVGGDIYIGRNWNRAAAGIFTHNDRAVFMNTNQDGTITANGNGQYFPYLYITKTAAADSIRLLDSIAIGKEMSVTAGTFDLAAKDAVLLSNATETARFGTVGGSGDVAYSGVGRFIVERYIPTGTGLGQHGKTWQFLSVPTNGGQTIRQAWQEGASTPNQNNKPGYGTMITGNMTNATSLGFDVATAQSAGPGMKVFNSAGNNWTGVPNTSSTALHNAKGYMIFVRGDRSVTTFSGPTSVPVPTNMRSRGKLFVPVSNPAPVTTVSAGSFESIGNPLASAVDFTLLSKPIPANLDEAYYVWDPLLPGPRWGLGGYQLIASSNAYKPSPGGTANYSNAVPYTKIQSGQAFMVHATGAGGNVSFPESCKITGSPMVYRGAESPNTRSRYYVRTELYQAERLMDAAVAAFDPSFSNEYDYRDALKFTNGAENIGINCRGNWVGVEARLPVMRRDTVFYQLSGMLADVDYQFRIGPEKVPQGITIFLVDQYLGSAIPVSSGDSTYYDFTINAADPASAATDRFMLVFTRGNAAATANNHFPVTLSSPVRVDGKNTGSTPGKDQSLIGVYPNPVTDGVMNLSFTGVQPGNYQLRLADMAGRTVLEQALRINQSNDLRSLTLPDLAPGVYALEVRNGQGRRELMKVVVK